MKPNHKHYLIRWSRKLPSGKRSRTWMLRWFNSEGRPQHEVIGSCDEMTKAKAEEKRAEREAAARSGEVSLDKPKDATLEWLRDNYAKQREVSETADGVNTKSRRRSIRRLDGLTIYEHAITIRYLIEHFGDKRLLSSITATDAEEWVNALETGKLATARKASKRQYTLGEQTIRKHLRTAKAIYNWAKAVKLVHDNPFTDFDAAALPGKPLPEVSADLVEKLIAATESRPMQAFVGLCRYAGLRKGEALALPWSGTDRDSKGVEHWVGVNWETRRIHLVAKKKSARYKREVPICPRLYDILLDNFNAAPDGNNAASGLSKNNIYRKLKALMETAGVKQWPKVNQSMRTSRENDLKVAGIAADTYSKWQGHSVKVSENHYTAPTDAEFAAVTNPKK